ncbi:Maf family protein [bacterium]|nr:Maf family protein [bacterium]
MNGLDFILASASPRRRQLCEEAGYRFEVRVSKVEEPPADHFAAPEAYASHTAWLKANDVAHSSADTRWVVGADTIVALGSDIIGKPADRNDAERILRSLSGTRHRVITGLCVALPREHVSIVDHIVTTVEMNKLTEEELKGYLDTNLWEGKAGAYGIQDDHDPFVAAVEGSFSNVVGLPMERLREIISLCQRMTGSQPLGS